MLLRFPVTLEEAQDSMAEGAVPVGGGTLQWPLWQRGGFPDLAMSMRDLPEATTLGFGHVGAAVTLDRIDSRVPDALRQAAAAVGNPAVRQTATVGGNLAGTGPRCLLPAFLALEARALVLDDDGPREADLAQALTEHQLLVRLDWREPVASAYRKLAGPTGEPSPAAVATALHAPADAPAYVRVAVRHRQEVRCDRAPIDDGIASVLERLRTTFLGDLPAEPAEVVAEQLDAVLSRAASA